MEESGKLKTSSFGGGAGRGLEADKQALRKLLILLFRKDVQAGEGALY